LSVVSLAITNDTPTTATYTLSLHDALPICYRQRAAERKLARIGFDRPAGVEGHVARRRADVTIDGKAIVFSKADVARRARQAGEDRKSTRLNSSHVEISYAVFCLKKKKTIQ